MNTIQVKTQKSSQGVSNTEAPSVLGLPVPTAQTFEAKSKAPFHPIAYNGNKVFATQFDIVDPRGSPVNNASEGFAAQFDIIDLEGSRVDILAKPKLAGKFFGFARISLAAIIILSMAFSISTEKGNSINAHTPSISVPAIANTGGLKPPLTEATIGGSLRPYLNGTTHLRAPL